jgi:hypothetical protein
MRWERASMVLNIGLLLACCAGPNGIAANDTGGIIPWSPENQRAARTIASELCARYNKYARITSVHAQRGDYIGFTCVCAARQSG